ncbi:hypothetical protein EJB05_26042 [Eragrostis curvula]|uniref:DUF3615 domain-containing protein n=1 Tax=Eragrostis curvula TaxID=38414 RepID=A0A5J9UIR6_9POAL|nr:hypothetical protein EJB05_26042 [Eragrostis curvula]
MACRGSCPPPSPSSSGVRSSLGMESPKSVVGCREMVRETVKLREPRVNHEVRLAQSKRFAEGALEHYNKRKKVKFELVDVLDCISMPEPPCFYTHTNFTARSSKIGSQEKSFTTIREGGRVTITARLRKGGSQKEPSVAGRRPVRRGFAVTCCVPLGPDYTVGRKLLKRDDTSVVRKSTDFTYCYGCTEIVSHPKGEKYVAGHCNIPRL